MTDPRPSDPLNPWAGDEPPPVEAPAPPPGPPVAPLPDLPEAPALGDTFDTSQEV